MTARAIAMVLPRFIEIGGRRYVARFGGAAPRSGDAAERYREPSLFTVLERSETVRQSRSVIRRD